MTTLYRIHGTDAETGLATSLAVRAASEPDARRTAQSRGIVVSRVVTDSTVPAPAEPAPSPVESAPPAMLSGTGVPPSELAALHADVRALLGRTPYSRVRGRRVFESRVPSFWTIVWAIVLAHVLLGLPEFVYRVGVAEGWIDAPAPALPPSR